MSLILSLETATSVCSVTLARGNQLLAIRETLDPNAHSSVLTPFIEEVIHESGITGSELDAIAVSTGPGSYTGLRIGMAVAKGLCYAIDKPLIAVPTLQAMAAGVNEELRMKNYEFKDILAISSLPPYQASSIQHPVSSIQYLVCPMIDARRMEVYCAVYNETLQEIREIRAEILNENSFSDLFADHVIIFAGDGASKSKSFLSRHPKALFMEDFRPSSRHMITLATERFNTSRFENLAYVEPFYLKDFIAGKPRVKGLS